MFIWWGRGVRHRNVSHGQFACPICKSQQHCSRRRVARYFTLYFIPLFEMESLREYLVCHGCKLEFPADSYADATPGQVLEAVTWSCPTCQHANPNHTFCCRQCGVSLV